jgi:serine/threonine-protein kinase
MELLPGTYVTPNVCLVQHLGEGGMGSVWVADHLSLKTRVAVKFVSADLVKADPSIVERFKREAALCAQIKSPHVVQTFDHGVMDDGRPYIVMELLEGESLQARMDRAGQLSLEETKAVINQTCKALSKAHRLGIVHRDIKPDNLFLTHDEDDLFLLKILDFGIAKQTNMARAENVTSTGTMVGTPEYMSPEQVLSSRSVDFKSDLWAVGVVAYHCLCGRVPFRGETLGSLCVAIASAKFAPPTQHRAELPAAVDRWFEMALATDPERRHASAKDMAQAFARALDPHAIIDEQSSLGDGAPWEATGEIKAPSAFAATAASIAKPSPTFTGAAVTNPDAPSRRGRGLLFAILGAIGVGIGVGAVYWIKGPPPVPPVPLPTAPAAPAGSGSIAAEGVRPAASSPAPAASTSAVETPTPSASATPAPPPRAPSAAVASGVGTGTTPKIGSTTKPPQGGNTTAKPDATKKQKDRGF